MALKTGVSWLCLPIIHFISSPCGEVRSLTGFIFDLSHRTTSLSGNLYTEVEDKTILFKQIQVIATSCTMICIYPAVHLVHSYIPGMC